MDCTDAAPWLVSVCASTLRQSQAKILAALVHAALRCERISLANPGRRVVAGQAQDQMGLPLHRQRPGRAAPGRVAMAGVLTRLLRPYPGKRPLLVSLGWTDFRGLTTLMAAANLKRRALPIVWASCHKHVYDGHRSHNAFEESLLLMLNAALPPGQRVIILADRGLGRTERCRFCQSRSLNYVIRNQGKGDIALRFRGGGFTIPV